MQAALESVEGVEGVVVDFDAGQVQVMTDGSADPAAMVKALEDAGFGGSVK